MYSTNTLAEMVVSVVRTYMYVRVFTVKTKGVKKWTSPTYMCVCVCVHAHMWTKKYIAAKYVSDRWLNVCVCMYESMLTSIRNLVYWRIVNILIFFRLWMYFRCLYVLPFSAAYLKWCKALCLRLESKWRWKSEKRKRKLLSKAWNI